MKMKTVRAIALCLALLQLLFLLVACVGEETETTAGKPATTTAAPAETPTTAGKVETPTTETPTTETPTTEPVTTEPAGTREDLFYFAIDGEPQFEIVHAVEPTTELLRAIYAFADELEVRTGAFFEILTDDMPPTAESELLVGTFGNREDVRALTGQPTYTSAYIDLVGDTLVVSPYADYVARLFDRLLTLLYEVEEGVWAIERELIPYSVDIHNGGIPYYDTVDGRLMGDSLYTCSTNGYTVGLNNTNRTEFDAYLEKLAAEGYTLYAEETLGVVDYFTYVKKENTLHVQFIGERTGYEDEGESVKITWSENEWLPPVGEASAYTKLVDSSINNIARVEGAGGWGMGMIFQIADGSFIIVDGALHTSQDQTALLNFMKKYKPAEHERPVVACWLWTHAHGDHVDMCLSALRDFSTQVDIHMFAYNYPDFTKVPPSANAGDNYSTTLINRAKQYYPEAIHWIMHAGQKYAIADAVIQCWWTHEDVYPMVFEGVNDTDTVFSITIDGIRTMMLGDCENPNGKMIKYFCKEMKSHVVQNSHHSINGPTEMYEYIDPIHSFWACSASEVEARSKRQHAQYLLNTQWTRFDENGAQVCGDRQHYNNSFTTRLLIKEIKAVHGNLS